MILNDLEKIQYRPQNLRLYNKFLKNGYGKSILIVVLTFS